MYNLVIKRLAIIQKTKENHGLVSTYGSRIVLEKLFTIYIFSSNINEVIRVISCFFYKKILQAKKSTRTHTTFLNTHKKHLRRRKSLI